MSEQSPASVHFVVLRNPDARRGKGIASALFEPPAVRQREHGFTLVEMLVVIGMIALLITILLPALQKAREAANSIKCAANLRTIGEMMMMHANEHRQCMPLAGAQRGGSDSKATPDDPANLADPAQQKYDYFTNGGLRPLPLPAALAPYFSVSCRTNGPANCEADISTGPLFAAFTCPSDPIPDNNSVADLKNWGKLIVDGNDSTLGSYVTGYTSYFPNVEALGYCPCNGNNNNANIQGHSRAAGFIPAMGSSPTQLVLMADGLMASGGVGSTFQFSAQLSPSTLADVFNGNSASAKADFDLVRHHGKMNALFLDGHVETLTITNTGGTTTGAGVVASGDLAHAYMVNGFPH